MSRVAKTQQPGYIACQDWDFYWEPTDLLDVICMWQHGKPLWEIAEYVGRPPREVTVLLMDLAETDHIGPRPGGAFGLANVSSQQGVHKSVHNSKSSVEVVGCTGQPS